MSVVDLVLAPYRTTRLAAQVLGELHAIAERVLEGDDPFAQLRDAIRDGLEDLDSVANKVDSLDRHLAGLDEDVTKVSHQLIPLMAMLHELIAGGTDLTAVAKELDRSTKSVMVGAASLEGTAARLDGTATEIVTGGRELTETVKSLDGHSVELIDGGLDLCATAKHVDANVGQLNELATSLEASARRLSEALPQLLGALGPVEGLEESLETVADTIEPLQATAEKVGRVTQRFSRTDS
ncbi:MAG: hypothetical protein M3417_06265 [Actinomycetota bacterium]|nr:hypothetical protein [Actinomycetota bacterium]